MEPLLKLDDKGQGGFYIMDGDKQLGEMAIGISGKTLPYFILKYQPKQKERGWQKRCSKPWCLMPENTK